MGKIIYIRHSDDEGGDCSKLQDCQLNEDGRKLAVKIGKKLIEKHGFPNIIFCSPFRRTLQTMENMLTRQDKSTIKIHKETKLSRYFSSAEKRSPDVDPMTLKADIDIHESYDEFKDRITKFADSIEHLTQSNHVIWCITHTTVYKRLSKKYEIKLPKFIPFMHYFILDSQGEVSGKDIRIKHKRNPTDKNQKDQRDKRIKRNERNDRSVIRVNELGQQGGEKWCKNCGKYH